MSKLLGGVEDTFRFSTASFFRKKNIEFSESIIENPWIMPGSWYSFLFTKKNNKTLSLFFNCPEFIFRTVVFPLPFLLLYFFLFFP